ncbi:hypothetical protein L484_006315 [Morus notabilis]|uniref:Uncharacterized protein n=1 Tax=Morus notabilis TaxID=981085 RepID=W9R4X9_9ROSA|nr:hypothetical protein L484_006315 [Morus notabilis]
MAPVLVGPDMSIGIALLRPVESITTISVQLQSVNHALEAVLAHLCPTPAIGATCQPYISACQGW